MTQLDEFIHKHRSDFNDHEPDPGHFSRFEQRLVASALLRFPPIHRGLMLKVAAIILLFISVSVFIFDLSTRAIRERLFNEQAMTELPVEIREAMQYYDQKADRQLVEINKLATTGKEAEELNQSAIQQIKALDDNTLELRKNLNENPDNGRIQDAILQNQKMKEGVLNTIISQLNLQKK